MKLSCGIFYKLNFNIATPNDVLQQLCNSSQPPQSHSFGITNTSINLRQTELDHFHCSRSMRKVCNDTLNRMNWVDLNKPKFFVNWNPSSDELRKEEVNTDTIQQKKICQLSLSFQKDDTSSIEKSKPPTGAPNAADTPAAAPADTKFLLKDTEIEQEFNILYWYCESFCLKYLTFPLPVFRISKSIKKWQFEF